MHPSNERRIDDLGRVAIPKEMRRMLNIKEGDRLNIHIDIKNKQIILHPKESNQ